MVSLALQEAYMQDPLITIRVVIFASWWKRTYQFGVYCFGLTPSRQVFMRIMAPISAILQSMDDWLILVSSELVTSVSRRGIRSLPFMARPPPDGSTISCDYSRIFCQPHLLQRPSGIVSWATYRSLVFSSLTGCSEWGCSSLASRINGIFWTTSFRSPGSLSIESFFFSGGLEWPSCVKVYPSLLQSKKSSSDQTLRMWVAGPHKRTPHLEPFVSSSEDSLHQPERASSSSVRPEGLRTPVGRPVGHCSETTPQ